MMQRLQVKLDTYNGTEGVLAHENKNSSEIIKINEQIQKQMDT